MKNFCVQLKVCEGCGALFLRDTARCGQGAYCHRCERRLSGFPAAGKRSRPAWKPKPVQTALVAGGAR